MIRCSKNTKNDNDNACICVPTISGDLFSNAVIAALFETAAAISWNSMWEISTITTCFHLNISKQSVSGAALKDTHTKCHFNRCKHAGWACSSSCRRRSGSPPPWNAWNAQFARICWNHGFVGIMDFALHRAPHSKILGVHKHRRPHVKHSSR